MVRLEEAYSTYLNLFIAEMHYRALPVACTVFIWFYSELFCVCSSVYFKKALDWLCWGILLYLLCIEWSLSDGRFIKWVVLAEEL